MQTDSWRTEWEWGHYDGHCIALHGVGGVFGRCGFIFFITFIFQILYPDGENAHEGKLQDLVRSMMQYDVTELDRIKS